MDDAELVNKPLEAWTKWALVWLTVFPFVGILVSIRFHNREFLGGMPLFTFGRLCSVHLGVCCSGHSHRLSLLSSIIVPLCGTPLYKVE
jgi:cytochrome c oxidase cbb3-type subunit I/II